MLSAVKAHVSIYKRLSFCWCFAKVGQTSYHEINNGMYISPLPLLKSFLIANKYRNHKGVGVTHEITSPKKIASISPDDNEAVLVR